MFANLKNVKPGLSLNKDIQLRLNSEGDFYSSSLEQKLSRIYEADDYSVSANNTKPNVGGLCLVLSHKVNVWGIQNLFVAKCLSKLEVNKENVNNAEVSKDSPVKSICQEEVKLLKAVDAGNSGLGNYIGLHFLVSGKELYYGISDSMLYNLILAHQSNCVIPDLNASTLQTQ